MARAKSAIRRGRPAHLSREQVLDAALELLEHEGPERVTMARVAEVVGAAPMSLYTHVANRDDLLRGVLLTALGRLRIEVDRSATYQDRYRAWADAVRAHMLKNGHTIKILGLTGFPSAAFMRIALPVLHLLEDEGLRGAELADAVRWLAREVIGTVLLEILAGPTDWPDDEAALAVRLLSELPPGDREVLAGLIPHLAGHDHDRTFAFVVERTLVSLERFLVEARACPAQ